MSASPSFQVPLGALLLAGGALIAACSSELPRGTRPNLVLVSIDSLRPDHLGCYGYGRPTSPFLDSLAEGGVRFENAVSTTSWTLPSHASLFTGLLGPTHGVVDNGLALSEDHRTLAELLKEAGYHTAGFFGGPYLHPTFGLAQGFDVYESCMTTTPDSAGDEAVRDSASAPDGPSHHDVTGPRTREEVARWADGRSAAGSEEPFFLFLHLWDVHYDFEAPEEFEALFVDPDYSGPADGRLMSNALIRPGMNREDLAHVLALYDAEIRFTDHVLEGIFADLEERGLLEDTLVVVTADHGEEFFEHGQKGHNKSLFDEVLRIPLLVSWPGQLDGGRVVEDQVQLVDLMPTLLGFAGAGAGVVGQGRDLAPLLAGQPMAARDALSGLFIDGGRQRALRSNGRKVLVYDDETPAVYIDLEASPSEAFDAFVTTLTPHSQRQRLEGEVQLREAAKRADELRALLERHGPGTVELSGEILRTLQGLGYVDTGAGDSGEDE